MEPFLEATRLSAAETIGTNGTTVVVVSNIVFSVVVLVVMGQTIHRR